MVVYGLGGVGKTQLITEWCYKIEKPVFWFTASSAEELISQYKYQAQLIRDFAGTNNTVKSCLDNNYIPGRDLDLVKAWIVNYEDWVLILDNYDAISLDIEPFIPASYGRVLFTSRDRRAVGIVSNHGLELRRPKPREAEILFLRQCIPGAEVVEEDLESIREYSEIQNIVSSLDGFPLALSQAGAYIRENQPCSYKHYLNLLQVTQDREVLLRFKGVRPEYPESVMTTWEISMNILERKYPEAAELLQLLGFFAQSGVPEQILFTPTKQQFWCFGNRTETRELDLGQKEKLKFLNSQAECTIYIGILISLSLMSKSQDGVISVHPLVHEWIQLRLRPTPSESFRFAYLCTLIIYQAYRLEYHGLLEAKLRPHLSEIYRNLQQAGRHPNSIPLEIRTVLLADVLAEVLNGNISLKGIDLPGPIATSPSETGSEEEPLDAIQPKLFDIIRSTQLPSPDSLRQVMELIQSSVSIYTIAPQWKPSRKIYLVILVTLVLNLVEWCYSTLKPSGDEPNLSLFLGPPSLERSFITNCERLIPECRQSIILALHDLLYFFSLHTAKVPDEISFLKIRIKVMLGKVLTAPEYEAFDWQFVHDNLSLKQVACVSLSTVVTYSAACLRFSRSNPQDVIYAIQLSADAIQKWWEEERTKAMKKATDRPSKFLSSSFGRDIHFFIATDTRLELEDELGALQNESLRCIETLLRPVLKGGTAASPAERSHSEAKQRAIGTSMAEVLDALQTLQTTLEIMEEEISTVQLIAPDHRSTQDYRMNRLSAYAYFLMENHRRAMEIIKEIFHADQIMTALNVENRDPRRLLTRAADYRVQNDQLSEPFQVGHSYSLSGVGLSGLRQLSPFPLTINTNGFHQDYQYPTIDVDEFKDLLRLWIACLKSLRLANTDQIRKWREECEAISNRDSLDSLLLIYTLAKCSKSELQQESNVFPSGEQAKVKAQASSDESEQIDQQEVKRKGGNLNCSLM
ncbi:hypothetical protein GGR51DRAFT_229239 [Nemania sp. FL0031]|nr:hypothetical protein GGR51DRAFT_229239 [Nemania sp. FL0031]